jgi:hypothetical protein
MLEERLTTSISISNKRFKQLFEYFQKLPKSGGKMWLYKVLYWDDMWFPIPSQFVIASTIEAAWRYAQLHKPETADHIRVCKARDYELNN